MKEKIAIAKLEFEAWIVRHIVTMMVFAILVVGDYWSDKIEAIAESIEDFCYGPLDMSRSMSETVTEIFMIYVMVCVTNWIVRMAIKHIGRLFTKKTTEKAERSA